MFVFRTPKFEDWREIDIELTADRPGGVVTNLIYANNVGGWNPDIQEFGDQFPTGPGTRALPAGFTHQGAVSHLRLRVAARPDHLVRRRRAGAGEDAAGGCPSPRSPPRSS